jgi:peptidoglycan hydrolase CwlO-like protein
MRRLTSNEIHFPLPLRSKEDPNAPDYNAGLRDNETAAKGISQGFTDIQTQVSSFRAQFNDYYKSVRDQLADEISDLQDKVTELKANLEYLERAVSSPS